MSFNGYGDYCGMDIYVLFGVAMVVMLTVCCMYCVKHDHDIHQKRNGMLHNNTGSNSKDEDPKS